jgi:hypothetical protein
MPRFSRYAAIASRPAALEHVENSPDSDITPSSVKAFSMVSTASFPPSSGCMTTFIGMPYFFANSKSRWSCAGTLMTAPVP